MNGIIIFTGNAPRFSDVAQAATDRWPFVLTALGVEEMFLRRRHGPCPGCGGRDRFRFDNRDGRGTFICGAGGNTPIAGDGFELLRHVHGWSRPEALKAVAGWLGMGRLVQVPAHRPPADNAKAEAKREAETQRNRARMMTLWSGARLIAVGDSVARYLSARGLLLAEFPAALRYHPELPYWHEINGKACVLGRFPAMLAIITDTVGRWVGLHRTYLTESGTKAVVRHPKTGETLPAKKMLSVAPGACMGAAVRLGDPVSGELVVTEGIETALAAAQLSGRPAWACLSAHGMESVQIIPSVRDVLIAADHDANRAGQNAARALARRLFQNKEIIVRMVWPDRPGTDWLDVLNSAGGAA